MFEKEKIDSILKIIKNSNLSYTQTVNLIKKIQTANEPQPRDGDTIVIDKKGRLIKGKRGNRINRIENTIKESNLDEGFKKGIIIQLIEDIRLFYGNELIKVEQGAENIMELF
jgi:hypothetical protein